MFITVLVHLYVYGRHSGLTEYFTALEIAYIFS